MVSKHQGCLLTENVSQMLSKDAHTSYSDCAPGRVLLVLMKEDSQDWHLQSLAFHRKTTFSRFLLQSKKKKPLVI